ncbi:class I SAM-dependent methyltransferase [Aquimarina sp. M1]
MQIHETAFIISTYRSYHEDISKDIYAKLWNNSKTEELIPTIIKAISTKESILHSIRNRFFYERMKSFFNMNNGGSLINFGAGFSMYQFLMDDTVSTIEIDKENIINYKKEKVDLWTREGKLPERDIQYVSVDFNTDTVEEIIATIKPLIPKKPTFILLEGVLFFLDRGTTNKLFSIFKKLQNTRDLVGSVSYLPEVEDTEVYKRLLYYFDSHNDTSDSFSHQTIPNSFYENIKGYMLKEHADEYNLSKIYASEFDMTDKTEILNENMYVLERN